MKRIFPLLFAGIILFQLSLHATELMPWTERDLELYPRFDYLVQHYDKIHSTSGSKRRTAYDHFFTLGLSGSYSAWSAEVETTLANTRHRSLGFDNLKLTGRYQWYNDILGDDTISITPGITLSKASKVALKDLSSFHHGRNSAEAHLSIGKEMPCLDTWSSRGWGVLGIGVGDHGSPWLRSHLAWEKHFVPSMRWRVFCHALYGLGGNSLSFENGFSGYGSISHRSVDVGTSLQKATDCWGTFHLEYSRRVYACNFPQSADLVKISYIYPFGL